MPKLASRLIRVGSLLWREIELRCIDGLWWLFDWNCYLLVESLMVEEALDLVRGLEELMRRYRGNGLLCLSMCRRLEHWLDFSEGPSILVFIEVRENVSALSRGLVHRADRAYRST